MPDLQHADTPVQRFAQPERKPPSHKCAFCIQARHCVQRFKVLELCLPHCTHPMRFFTPTFPEGCCFS